MPNAEATPGPRILVLEDEPPLRRMLEEILAMKGYASDSVATVEEAVQLWRREMTGPNPFRLALTDLTLGDGPGGLEFARRLRMLDPESRMIACTGDSSDPVMADSSRFGFQATLSKPFLLGTLLETVGLVLADPPGPA
ncbi:MAG TPA: response regulator [Fibrobacteria bacterium]|nr:response regulator [Fibrobacteria bacterium]